MPESEEIGAHPAAFAEVDLTGARFTEVRLTGAQFRRVDLTGAVLRDVALVGAAVDGMIEGLTINGVEVAPLVEAELVRRDPTRALLWPTDPAGCRQTWQALQRDWQQTYDRVAALPAAATGISVAEEWSFGETLRHLIFATDGWLGAILGETRPFHAWGLPFTGVAEFVPGGAAALGIDEQATPTYEQILRLRTDRVAKVGDFLDRVSAERLADSCPGPPWEDDSLTVLRCLWVIFAEECEHRRFAERDLALIEAGGSD